MSCFTCRTFLLINIKKFKKREVEKKKKKEK